MDLRLGFYVFGISRAMRMGIDSEKFKGGKWDAKVFSIFVHENDFLNDFKARGCIAEVLTVL